MTFRTSWPAAAVYEALGEEQILEWRASGMSVREIRERAKGTVRGLYFWMDHCPDAKVEKPGGRTLRERWEAAGKMGAEAIVDGTAASFERLRDPDTLRMKGDVSREEIALAKAESDFTKFRVGAQDPARFRDSARAAGAVFNIGEMHLTAVRRVADQIRLNPAEGEDEIADAVFDEVPITLTDEEEEEEYDNPE